MSRRFLVRCYDGARLVATMTRGIRGRFYSLRDAEDEAMRWLGCALAISPNARYELGIDR